MRRQQAINVSTRFRFRRRPHRTRRTTRKVSLARSRLRSRTIPLRGEGTRRRLARRIPHPQQITLRRRTTPRHMRAPALRSLRGTRLSQGTTATVITTTTRPPSLMFPQPTSPHLNPHMADHSQHQQRHPRLRKDMSLRCIAHNMRRQQRRPPSRHNTKRHIPQRMGLSSIQGPRMLRMVALSAKAPHTLCRTRTRRTLCTRRFPSALPTLLTRIHSRTECHGLALSRHRCHPRQLIPRRLPSFRDTRQTRRFLTARWMTYQRNRTGG